MSPKFICRDLIWLAVCVGLCICFVVGILCSKNANSTGILSSVSTVTSIVLSVVAIAYSFVEGTRNSKLNQEMDCKLDKIQKLQEDVNKKIETEQQLLQQINAVKPAIQKLKEKEMYNKLSASSRTVIDGLQNYFDQYADE